MRAIVYRKYGSPDVLELEELPKPTPGDDQVLVKIHASSVGTWDCEFRSFSFPLWFWLPLRIAGGIRTPRWPVLGQEFAGVIEAVGPKVDRFEIGDAVFGSPGLGFGAHAEYICLSSSGAIAKKPRNMSFVEAASLPTGGDNALHFLRRAHVRAGERVLVNGAAGNIGVVAVQLAKHYGAEVTAIDSGEKLEMLGSIGADHVIDYTQEDFTRSGRTYDVIFDLVHASSYSACVRTLAPKGRYLLVNPRFLPMLRAFWTSWTSDKDVIFAFAGSKQQDLVELGVLAEAGAIRAVVDRTFPLERAAEAHAYVDSGQRKGAVVLTIAADP